MNQTTDCAASNPMPEAANYRRPPEVVMRLARMGSFHQTRLSFMRALLRRLKQERWRFKRNLWAIDEQGFMRNYSLVAYRGSNTSVPSVIDHSNAGWAVRSPRYRPAIVTRTYWKPGSGAGLMSAKASTASLTRPLRSGGASDCVLRSWLRLTGPGSTELGPSGSPGS